MRLENRCVVPASPDETWNYLMDVATAARCVPGVVDVCRRRGGSATGEC